MAAALLIYRTDANEKAVTVAQQSESDTDTAGDTGLIPTEAIHTQSVSGTCQYTHDKFMT